MAGSRCLTRFVIALVVTLCLIQVAARSAHAEDAAPVTPKNPDKPAASRKPISKADAEALLAKLKAKVNTKRAGRFYFTQDRYDKLSAIVPYLDRAVRGDADLIENATLFAEGKLPENAFTLFLNEALNGYTKHIPQAAKAGKVSAMLEMALMLETGRGVEPNLDESRKYLERAAAKGSRHAMLQLGERHRVGTGGVARHYAKAIVWYEKAAEKGSAMAVVRLAEFHFVGHHFKVDKTKAIALVTKARAMATDAAKKNDVENLYVVGYLSLDDGDMGLEKNPAVAIAAFRKAIALGHARSMNSLAYMYHKGLGVEEDQATAVDWWRKADKLGNLDGTLWLAHCYRSGVGVKRDYTKAKSLYGQAVLRGNAFAMNEYGYCFDHPLGGKQDFAEAMKWYEAAATLNHPKGTCNVGTMYYFEKGVSRDLALAVDWWQKAADLGDNDAMYKIARLYNSGEGFERDAEVALKWYLRAAKAGNQSAQTYLRGKNIKWESPDEKAPAGPKSKNPEDPAPENPVVPETPKGPGPDPEAPDPKGDAPDAAK